MAVYHPQSSEAQRELEMDPNLPLFRVLIRLAHGIGLPVDAVKKIRNEFLSWYYQTVTLIGTRRLENRPLPYPFSIYNRRIYRGWAGNQRANNRQNLVDMFWAPTNAGVTRYADSYQDHLFTLQFPQPLVY